MATLTRQPFAPLDGARLQNLTSLKNRQNAVASSPVKRKASEIVDTDDSENIDPIIFSKRSKGLDNAFPSKDFVRPSTVLLTKSSSTSHVAASHTAAPRPRNYLHPKSPVAKLHTGIVKSSPLSAPAGRSPTRGKRTGILSSRRRTAGPYHRIDPPSFGVGRSSASTVTPFSLEAALKGTIPSYTSHHVPSKTAASLEFKGLHDSEMKSSWFFDIHEDTAEQEMTNLLQHSTCVLDISSDEESETKRQRERAEGKENVPPVDDISQTSRPRAARQAAHLDDMLVEKERAPLNEMDASDYYAEGCDESSVVLVPGDEDEEQQHSRPELDSPLEVRTDHTAPPESSSEDGTKSVEELMQKMDEPAPPAALLQPIEDANDSFEVWESSSSKDEAEATEC